MDSLEEDLALLTESANRLVCKEGSFSLKASSEATVKVENLILVGKIVAERVINKNKVAVITQKAWKPTKGMSVKMVGENLFLFTFNEAGDKRRVEVQAPWNIDGFHLILKRVKRNQLPREVDFSTTFFWAQAHNLPLEYLTKENAEIIGNGMGKYIEVDLSGTESSKGGNFLRFKVEIKSSAPLLKGFWLERTQLSDLWVQLKYERLPDFCYLCGRLGHMKKECTKSGAREEGDEALDRNLKKFGPWLAAETVERKMHRASDLMFMDVIDEYSTEKQGGTSHSRIVVEGGASASELHAVDERVEELISLCEADVRLKKVSAGNVGDLTGSREQFHPMPVRQDDAGVPFVSQRVEATLVNTPMTCGPTGISLTKLESVISPQLVISFGPVGPIEKQIVPVGLSLTQAHFMAWPSVIHADDLLKPKSSSVTIKESKEVGHVPMDIATLGCFQKGEGKRGPRMRRTKHVVKIKN